MEMKEPKSKLCQSTVAANRRLIAGGDDTLARIAGDDLPAPLAQGLRKARTGAPAEAGVRRRLRHILSEDFAHARSWPELMARLAAKGITLRSAGGGLALHGHPDSRYLCRVSEIGQSYCDLMQRFGAPLPGHSHRYAVDRLLDRTRN